MPWLNVRANNSYRGVYRIHPLRQREVEEVLELIQREPAITKAVVFGSSTEERCTPDSDVDILLFGQQCNFRAPVNDVAYDILWSNQIPEGDALWREIERDGVVIYEA